MSVDLIPGFVQAASETVSWSLPLVHAAVGAVLGFGHELANGLLRCNFPFCTYGAVASAMGLKAYIAFQERKLEHAHENSVHGLAAAILAFAHLLG